MRLEWGVGRASRRFCLVTLKTFRLVSINPPDTKTQIHRDKKTKRHKSKKVDASVWLHSKLSSWLVSINPPWTWSGYIYCCLIGVIFHSTSLIRASSTFGLQLRVFRLSNCAYQDMLVSSLNIAKIANAVQSHS